MAGASVETTLRALGIVVTGCEGAASFPCFAKSGSRHRHGNSWMDCSGTSRARQGGCAQKRLAIPARGVSRRSSAAGRWDAEALRDIVGDYALETLADEEAVLVIDETGFLKQGKASSSVARQYTGSAGKITNCQIGVFVSYVSRHGHAFIDRALYLPKEWTDDPRTHDGGACAGRRRFCNETPDRAPHDRACDRRIITMRFLSRQTACMARETSRPCSARRARVMFLASPPIMCSVRGARRSWSEAPPRRSLKIFPRALGGACRRAKEPRDRACMTGPIFELADLDASEYNSALAGKWARGLLIRRNIAAGDLAFFSTWCPKHTPMKKLVSVEGHRWAIKDGFETPDELGLDHNETRSWHGWHRHLSLVMLAFAMMAVIRHRADVTPPKKTMRHLPPRHRS